MAVKDLKTVSWSIAEANTQTQRDLSPEYWAFLIAQVNYSEVTFDSAAQQVTFAEYIPLRGLLAEVLTRIENGNVSVTQCRLCEHYFDMNNADGIFGDTDELARFICKDCASTLSAWDFYHQHLKID